MLVVSYHRRLRARNDGPRREGDDLRCLGLVVLAGAAEQRGINLVRLVGCRVGFGAQESKFRIESLGSRALGSEFSFRAKGSRFTVQGLGFRV